MRKCKINKIKKENVIKLDNKPKKKKKKKNALIMCRDGNEFWTTQDQFWQWVRESVIIKSGDAPLRGKFVRENDQFDVVIGNAILNIKHRNHLREVLYSRRYQA